MLWNYAKIMIVAVLILSLLLFSSCINSEILTDNGNVQQVRDYSKTATDTQFERISSGSRFSVVRETRTDILYMCYYAGNKGGLTVMLDTNGLPLTYERWKELA